ncbi:aconitase X [Aliamphritea spongicola]|uniref:aconitase X n=1 Tax=Aliamphritea spongicola TaxID=707589 RepID=UPI00196B8532|nr:aconitase X [Aliamphritea spongicola]MBN3560828.1 DUF521 domain-containing protein [Aliamphritea spongicola]
MQLNAYQERMLKGEMGASRAWAMQFQLDTGRVLSAESLTPIRYAFFMADTDAMGEAGIRFLEELAEAPAAERQPLANFYLESRHTASELQQYGLPDWFMALDQRRLNAIARLGCHMDYNHINHHSVPAPCFGESIAMGSTPSAIYANSALGARTNFEAGPAGLAAALTGFVPCWGLHLPGMRRPKRRFHLTDAPQTLTEWGALGAVIGGMLKNIDDIPLISGISAHPGALALSHLGAAMASYGAVGLFHIAGVTPEAHLYHDLQLPEDQISRADLLQILTPDNIAEQPLDLVVTGAPQMCWSEVLELHEKLANKLIHPDVTFLAFTDKGSLDCATSLGVTSELRASGCRLLDGIDFFQSGSEPMRKNNGWKTALTPSPKLGNILNGAGYQASAASLDTCIASAIAGRVVDQPLTQK